MRPGIEQTFWSDRDIEAQDSSVKLTLLWLITNSQTSWLGVCTPSLARFQFETGLPAEALDKTLQALPNTVVRVGKAIFLKNYIRHQFGTGETLIRNNFFRGLKPRFAAIKDQDLQAVILAQYPEFNEALTKPSEGFTKPKRREEKYRTEKKGSAEGRKSSKTDRPSLDEAIAFGAELSMSKERVESWFYHFESNGWLVSGKTPMKNWRASLRGAKDRTFDRQTSAQPRVLPSLKVVHT